MNNERNNGSWLMPRLANTKHDQENKEYYAECDQFKFQG